MATSSFANKRAVESMLVFKAGEVLSAAGAALSTAAGNVNLNDGQLGVFEHRGPFNSPVLNTSVDHTTAAAALLALGKIQFFQGTANSANIPGSGRYPMGQRPYLKSGIIDTNRVNYMQYRAYRAPKLSSWVVGNRTGTVDTINILDDTEYSLKIGMRGRRQDEVSSSVHGRPSFTPSMVTPDYTTLGTVSPLDHLVKNLAFAVNRSSREFNYSNPSFGGNQPMMAFAIRSLVGGPGVSLTAASAVGVTIPTVVLDSVTRNVITDAQLAGTIADIVTAAPAGGNIIGTSTIELIDLSTAGTAVDADCILIIGMDEYNIGFDDRIPEEKIRLEIGLFEGFTFPTVNLEQPVRADEGEGKLRQWQIYYNETAGQRWYSQNRSEWPILPNGSSAGNSTGGSFTGTDLFEAGTNYDSFIIHHDDFRPSSLDSNMVSPQKTIILVPTGEAVVANLTTLFTGLGF